ncbi:MAG TPA: FAD-dependent oxidoreductase, partial [Methylomirabilota bacterium]|nr:FAD-dependent oxidoreductase [Methylomirabilota bacterium]
MVGLAAAWHLLRLGCRPVAVVERFRIGHDRGGSHGSVRMTRSAYASPVYAGLMRHVREQEWPRLERAAGLTLVHPRDVLFFGPDRAALGAYAAAVQAAGADVASIPIREARRRFPSLRFDDDMEILLDRTGGSVAADGTIHALHRLVTGAGGVVLEDTRVVALDGGASTVRVVSERGVLRAERLVVATGAWLHQLVPASARAVTVVPQTVAYFRLDEPAATVPSWIRFDGPDDITYGLPEIGRDALKVGRHVTKGPGADPDEIDPPSAGEVEALRHGLGQILTVPIRELVGAERCLYTMTPTEDFVIDRSPDDPRVVFASACSGHGFKFA